MNDGRGWTTSEHDLRVIWVLDWLYDHQPRDGGQPATVRGFNGEAPTLAEDDLRQVFATINSRGFLDLYAAMDDLDTPVSLTPTAIEDVRRRQARRMDAAARSRASRDAVLAWIYSQRSVNVSPVISGFILDPRGFFEGEAFTTQEVSDATIYLRDRDLIRGGASWGAGILRPSLTADGIDCVENYDSDVRAYLNRHAVSLTNTTWNVSDVDNFNLANNSPGAHQSITVTNADVQGLLDVVRPIVQALTVLGLDQVEQARIRDYANEIETEAGKPEPNRGRLKQLGGFVVGIVKNGSASALAATLTNSAPAAIEALSHIPH